MKAWLPGSLQGIVTLIVFFALMPAMGLMAWSGHTGAREEIAQRDRAALRLVNSIARQQISLVESTRTLLFTLSALSEVRAADPAACSALFRQLALHAPVYADIRLCDAEGGTLASSRPQALSAFEIAQVRSATSSSASFSVQERPSNGRGAAHRINCLLPVREKGRTTVLMASIIVRVAAPERARMDASPAERLHIVDRLGNSVFVYPQGDATPVPDSARAALRAAPGASGILHDSERTHIAFEKLFLSKTSEPDLTVFLSSSTTAILERMYARLAKDLLLLLTVSALALAITWKLCRASLLLPVNTLLDAAKRIEQGDLATRVNSGFALRELSVLADSFNSMTQALEMRDSELMRARDGATVANAAKSEFLATMSHEIRTPMNAILGMAYLAKNSDLTPRQKQYLDNIHKEAGAMLATINDILDFSKLEAGKVRIESVSFNPGELMGAVLRDLRGEAERRSVRLASSPAPDVPRALRGDPLHLAQVLCAILTRMLALCGEDGELLLRCETVDETPDSRTPALISGQASDKTSGRLVFTASRVGGRHLTGEAFFLENGEERPAAGQSRNLSLAIARKLLGLMQGRLDVGTDQHLSVRIAVPLLLASPQDVDPAREAAQDPDQESALDIGRTPDLPDVPDLPDLTDAADCDLKNVRVLLVEDNLINQQIAREMLASAGAVTRTARNGLEALALLAEMPRSAPFHLVLMDLQMPELDGFATTRRLRLDERFKSIPIIAMTAHSQSEEWRGCRDVGMNDYVAKPLDPPVFLHTVATWARADLRKAAGLLS